MLIIVLVFFPLVSFALTGGPDKFGYTSFDSNEKDAPEFYWTELCGTGTPLSLSNDSVSQAISIGFNFYFYGKKYSNVYVSSNGFISFNANTPDGCCVGNPIPSQDTVNNIIAALWNDLDPSG